MRKSKIIGWALALGVGMGLAQAPQARAEDGVTDNEILVGANQAEYLADVVRVKGPKGERELRVVASKLADYDSALVSAGTLAELGTPIAGAVLWLSVPERSAAVDALLQVHELAGDSAQVGGSVVEAAQVEQVLDLLLAITILAVWVTAYLLHRSQQVKQIPQAV